MSITRRYLVLEPSFNEPTTGLALTGQDDPALLLALLLGVESNM